MLGLALGVIGVSLVVGVDHLAAQHGAGLAVTAALLGAFSFGIAMNCEDRKAASQMRTAACGRRP